MKLGWSGTPTSGRGARPRGVRDVLRALTARDERPLLCAHGPHEQRATGRCGRDDGGEKDAVDPVLWMLVVDAHDLPSAESTDRGSEHNIARPVLVVVHAREADERCTAVEQRRHVPRGARPPA